MFKSFIENILVLLVAVGIAFSSAAFSAPPLAAADSSSLLIPSNHRLWDNAPDIRSLQQFLNTHGFLVASSGPGSPGAETTLFGLRTYRALVRFQVAEGLPATGFLGPLTRAEIGALSAASSAAAGSPSTATSPSSTPGASSSRICSAPSGFTCIPGTSLPQPSALSTGYTPGFGGGGGGGSSSPAPDTTPPTVSLTAPTGGATVSGSAVALSATASDNVAVANVQFEVDGTDIGSAISASPYTTAWNSTGVADGSHTLSAVAEDTSGNVATSSITITVDNTPPVISAISSGTPGATSATITWTTNKPASSTIAFGPATAYGSASSSAVFTTSPSITLSGLTAASTYHFQVQSTDAAGNLATSSDQTFTTAAPARAVASNGLAFPYTNTASTNNVRFYQKYRRVPSSSGFTNIELTYANFLAIDGGESTSSLPSFTLQAEILYNGTYYPVTFSGATSTTLVPGNYVTSDNVSGLALPANAVFYERVRTVGPSGSQNYLISNGANEALLEGALSTTSSSVNYLGGGEGHGGACTFTINGSGTITAGQVTAGGVNYTSAWSIAAVDPSTGPNGTVSTVGFSNGAHTTITISSGGSGWSSQTYCVPIGGGGFGQNTAVYAAALISGVPTTPGVSSLMIIGDSIARGYGASDSSGDLAGNYGIYERAVGNRFGVASVSFIGNTAAGEALPAAHSRMFAILAPVITHALIALGTNDIAGNGYSAATVAAANETTEQELKALNSNIKVSFATLVPQTSGTWSTLGGQTPVSGFTSGGAADTYNGYVRADTNGVVSDWNYLDPRTLFQDATSTDLWRVDQGQITNDGIHPNLSIGEPFAETGLYSSFNVLSN
jgi:hypothetical protein